MRFDCCSDKHQRIKRIFRHTWHTIFSINLLSRKWNWARVNNSVNVCRFYLLNRNANSCQLVCCSQKQTSSVYGNLPLLSMTYAFIIHKNIDKTICISLPQLVTPMWVTPLNAKPIIIYQVKCYLCTWSWYLVSCYQLQQIFSCWTCSRPYAIRLVMVNIIGQSHLWLNVRAGIYHTVQVPAVLMCFSYVVWLQLWAHPPSPTTPSPPPPPPPPPTHTHTHPHLQQP